MAYGCCPFVLGAAHTTMREDCLAVALTWRRFVLCVARVCPFERKVMCGSGAFRTVLHVILPSNAALGLVAAGFGVGPTLRASPCSYWRCCGAEASISEDDCVINCDVTHRGQPWLTVVAETDALIFRASP